MEDPGGSVGDGRVLMVGWVGLGWVGLGFVWIGLGKLVMMYE